MPEPGRRKENRRSLFVFVSVMGKGQIGKGGISRDDAGRRWFLYLTAVDRLMGGRFFAAVFMEGNLHIHGIPERGPWDLTKLRWLTEQELDAVLLPAAGDRRIRTRVDLDVALMEPRRLAPTHQVWIHESLLDDARRLWEIAQTAQAADDHA